VFLVIKKQRAATGDAAVAGGDTVPAG